MDEKLTVNDFKKDLKDGVARICESYGWDENDASGRGWAFQYWCAEVLCNHDKLIETLPEDSLLYGNDMMADIVIRGPSQQEPNYRSV